MTQFGVARLGNFPSVHVFATQLLPVAGFAAGTLYYGNVAYLYLPVSLRLRSPAYAHSDSLLTSSYPQVQFILKDVDVFTLQNSGQSVFSHRLTWEKITHQEIQHNEISTLIGQLSQLLLQVAFIQVLKVATPLFTLLISATLGLESLGLLKCMSMLLILLGSGLATFIESNSAGFSWYGFGLMLFSALLEAVKVVYIQKLFGKLNYSSVELMVYLGPPTAFFLGTASWFLEGRGLIDYGFQSVKKDPHIYILAILGGFGVNLTTAYAIKATSSLTFKVWGCVKNTAVVVIGCLLGESMNAWQIFGYMLSTIGFILYSWTKSHPRTKLRKQSSE